MFGLFNLFSSREPSKPEASADAERSSGGLKWFIMGGLAALIMVALLVARRRHSSED